jgi:hypothetical protein
MLILNKLKQLPNPSPLDLILIEVLEARLQ